MSLNPNFIAAAARLYPNADFTRDVRVQDDGAGPYLAEWHLSEPPPTDEQIAAVLAQPVPATFVARDLIAQLTPADYAAIQTTIASSAPLGLMWAALLAQGEAPIDTSAERFKAGWAGLSQAIGTTRAAEIAAALKINP